MIYLSMALSAFAILCVIANAWVVHQIWTGKPYPDWMP